jgi:hypothetical protein
MRLRDADRALGSQVESETAHRLRRAAVAVASARASAPRPLVWSRPFVAAAATLALVCVTLITTAYESRVDHGTVTTAPESGDAALAAATEGAPGDRQQLQFSTPGGTRIIWVFDPGFDVKGTLP